MGVVLDLAVVDPGTAGAGLGIVVVVLEVVVLEVVVLEIVVEVDPGMQWRNIRSIRINPNLLKCQSQSFSTKI